jgi:hypothetical protein
MPKRSLKRTYQLDANRINARRKDCFVNQLEKWYKTKVIFLEMARVAYQEAGHGSPARSRKAADYTWMSTNDSLGGEHEYRRKIEQILFPKGAKNQNQRNDVWILFTAQRSGATLITDDGGSRSQPGGMLGNAQALAKLGIQVLSAQAAVAEIAGLISERDKLARQAAACTGARLPRWVGKDGLS